MGCITNLLRITTLQLPPLSLPLFPLSVVSLLYPKVEIPGVEIFVFEAIFYTFLSRDKSRSK